MKTNIDITHIPFSRYGAYVAVTRGREKDGATPLKELQIQSARQRFKSSTMYSVTFGREEPEDVALYAQMMWGWNEDLSEMMNNVALRSYVEFA